MRLDYAPGAVLYFKFATVRPSTGAPFALSGGTISVYKDNSTTQSTAGVTLTADFDSVTGLNHITLDTSADGTFYSTGSSFQLVITAGTVDSVSVVGQVVGEFSLNRTSALRPTTAGRTLDVTAGGAVTMGTDSFGTSLVVGNLATSSALTSVASDVTAIKAKTDTIPSWPTNFASLAITAGGAVTAGTVSDKTGYSLSQSFPANFASLGINSSGHISRVTLVDTTTTNTDMRGTDNAATATALASLVTTVGVAGAGLTALATAASLSTVASYIDTEVAAIKAKTDNLPSDPADASDIAAAFSTVNSTLATIAAYIDTEVAAIKTKTDGLPADTAATLTTIQGYVDTLETELAKVIKTGESRTIARTGKTDVTFTETRV